MHNETLKKHSLERARGSLRSTIQAAPPVSRIRDLQTETVLLSNLQPHAGNPRTHSKKQLRQIARSIEAFGWTNPILVDAEGHIIAGHGRAEAAKLLGLSRVPVIRIDDLTEAQKRAYVVADNRLAENAGWDFTLLATEISGLQKLDFDVTLTGFPTAEIDKVIEALGENIDDEDDSALPEIESTAPPIARLGDLWVLNNRHRLLCADSTQPESFVRLMGGQVAQMAFTDPPYNVRVQGHVSGLGSVKHTEFPMASGELTDEQFEDFLNAALELIGRHSKDGAIVFVFMDWRHIHTLLTAGLRVFSSLANLCVWVKSNAGMGSLYRSQHELICVFKRGRAPHINNVELGKHARNRSNAWRYSGLNSFGKDRDKLLAMHPTVKPVRLVKDAILDCSHRNGVVLDPFIGSGTTLIAAERAGRRCFGLELDPKFVDLALRRFRAMTGIEPVLAETGATFGEVEQARSAVRRDRHSKLVRQK